MWKKAIYADSKVNAELSAQIMTDIRTAVEKESKGASPSRVIVLKFKEGTRDVLFTEVDAYAATDKWRWTATLECIDRQLRNEKIQMEIIGVNDLIWRPTGFKLSPL